MDGELQGLGDRLRAARRDRGWTLAELASRASISASTLSRLESGKRQASLELLLPLTRELGIRVDDLLAPPGRDPRVRRTVVRQPGRVIAPLTAENSAALAYKITMEAGAELPEPRVHDGSDWIYVLSGRLRLLLGDQELTLGAGEAAEFDTRTPHAMAAAGDRPVEIISIFSESGARVHTRDSA